MLLILYLEYYIYELIYRCFIEDLPVLDVFGWAGSDLWGEPRTTSTLQLLNMYMNVKKGKDIFFKFHQNANFPQLNSFLSLTAHLLLEKNNFN